MFNDRKRGSCTGAFHGVDAELLFWHGYPQGTTFVYRSLNSYGGRAAARLNTDILVFAEKSFLNKGAALSFVKDLGLIDIINQAIGSIILVTPSDAKTGLAPTIELSQLLGIIIK